jgi:hypothetical protein
MEIFWRLAFSHLLGDFTFQSNYLAAWKRRNQSGLLVHMAFHLFLYVLMTWPYLNRVWVGTSRFTLTGWACIFLICALHYLEDWWRVWNVNHILPDNFLYYFWDQVIHLVVIFAVSPVPDGLPLSRWPALGCLFVLTTHCATVTIYYIEKAFYGTDYPPTEEKYLSMLIRMAETACFLLPGILWIGMVLFMAYRMCWHIYKKRLDFSWTSILLGNVIVLICGAAARYVFYTF